MSAGTNNRLFFNIPNLLTLSRIFMIPVLAIVFYLPVAWNGIGAAVLFALAAITDWFDGYVARLLKQSTAFGAFLDPVADKLMVVVSLVLLVEVNTSWLFTFAALIIIAREFTISALREWMAEMGSRASVAVSYIGKLKTTFQMIAIIGLLAHETYQLDWLAVIAYILLYSAVVLTIWSMVIYMKSAIQVFKEKVVRESVPESLDSISE